MPDLYVLDKSTKKPIHVEERFTSLVWTERYQKAGDFVLDIPVQDIDFRFYRRGNYLLLADYAQPMVIESIDTDLNIDEPKVEIAGRSLSSILDRRVNASKALVLHTESINYSGEVSSLVQSIVNDEIIDPKMQTYRWCHKDESGKTVEGYDYDNPSGNWKAITTNSAPERKISNFKYKNVNCSGTLDKKYDQLMSVYDILVSFSKKLKTGFRIVLNNGNFVLETYSGTDRTSGQKLKDAVIFNEIMDNIITLSSLEDQTDYKNMGIAYSDAAFSPVDFRVGLSSSIFNGYVWVENDTNSQNESYTDLDRFEIAFDARSSASVSSWDPYPYYYPDDDEVDSEKWIADKVRSVGETEFDTEEYDFVNLTEGEIDPLVRYEFGVDYFLGDTVEITNSNGVVMTALIDEVVTSYDADGKIVTPNFSNMEDYDYGDEDDQS